MLRTSWKDANDVVSETSSSEARPISPDECITTKRASGVEVGAIIVLSIKRPVMAVDYFNCLTHRKLSLCQLILS